MYIYINIIYQNIAREEERWKKLEDLKKTDEDRMTKIREEGLKAKKNTSGVAYDITTLHYNDNENGKLQQYSDDMGILYIYIYYKLYIIYQLYIIYIYYIFYYHGSCYYLS